MKIRCNACGEEYEVEETMQGKQFPCFKDGCGNMIDVPYESMDDSDSFQQQYAPHVTPPPPPRVKPPTRPAAPAAAPSYDWEYGSAPNSCLRTLKSEFSAQKILYSILILVNLLFWISFFMYDDRPHDEDVIVFLLIMLVFNSIFLLIFLCVHLAFIYNCWTLIPPERAAASPAKAIWMNFVPFLFPFWQWITYYELGKAFSDLTGARNNKVQAFIFSLMNFFGLSVLFIPWGAMLLSMESEFLKSAQLLALDDLKED